ncbi:MAG: flagellar basal body-associated protein FliL [Rhodospirillales bacterium]
MAENDDGAAAADGEPGGGTPIRRIPPRVKAIAAAAAVLIALAVGATGYLLLGSGGGGTASASISLAGPSVFHELPEFIVDLAPTGRSRHRIRLQLVAELASADMAGFGQRQVAVVDAVIAHLRGLTREDLVGASGAERLRGDLHAVVEREVAPARVRAILFKAFLMD